jgi:hypothetical protein
MRPMLTLYKYFRQNIWQRVGVFAQNLSGKIEKFLDLITPKFLKILILHLCLTLLF